MNLVCEKEIEFIPEFNGNKECEAGEQVVVIIKNPTLAMKDKIAARPETKARADTKGNVEGIDIILKEDDLGYVRTMVSRINNLSYTVGREQKFITQPADLISAPINFQPLLTEIIAKCKEVMKASEVNEKN